MCFCVPDRLDVNITTVTFSLNDINMIAHVGCFQYCMKLCWTNDLLGILTIITLKYHKTNCRKVQRYVWHALFCVVANNQVFLYQVWNACTYRLSPANEFVMFIKVHTEQQKWNEMKAVCFGLAFISFLLLCMQLWWHLMHIQSGVTELNWTEPNWHGSVFDELTNGQAVMHYSRHCITALVA